MLFCCIMAIALNEEDFSVNYIYLFAGLIVGIVFIGIAKNINRRKTVPYEVTKKLRAHKTMDEYNEWCAKEVLGDRLIGCGLIIFGISSTFFDSVLLLGGLLAVVSLGLFVVGYMMRIANNKKHLGHFFVR